MPPTQRTIRLKTSAILEALPYVYFQPIGAKIWIRNTGLAVAESLQSTSRLLILASAAIYFVFLLATVIWPVQLAINTWLIAPASIVLLLISLWLTMTLVSGGARAVAGDYGSVDYARAVYMQFQQPELRPYTSCCQ